MAVNGRETIAYFSMEVGIDPNIPTYSGGLGVLAGDTLQAAADIGVGMVGVTLLYSSGYFRQHLDEYGNQMESPSDWEPEEFMEPLSTRIEVGIEGRQVMIRAWRYVVKGVSGETIPVYFLDTDLEGNSAWDRSLTTGLYGGDARYRLSQEIILGMGGIYMLQALGHMELKAYHMNEGHSAFLGLALLKRVLNERAEQQVTEDDMEQVRWKCIFTTHTPVPEGHDQFPAELVRQVVGDDIESLLESAGCIMDGTLNMTHLALSFSHYVNGVSMRHEGISRGMFPGYPINSITNGVHALNWTSIPFRRLYDRYMPEWRRDNLYLRYAIRIPAADIQSSHKEAKDRMLAEVERRTGKRLNPDVLTLGFARRATAYKRADFFFYDIPRLKRMVRDYGKLQIIFGGKAHPKDTGGKKMIHRVFEAAEELHGTLSVVYLEGYDLSLARYLTSGVDLWLNTPLRPREASGTSGMKAAMNGVPTLSVLDGWWIEGHIEGVTGWSIGEGWDPESDPVKEIGSLYEKMERTIIPMYYQRPTEFAEVMRSTIALTASYYNSQRMVRQYLDNAYIEALRR
ncbi:MAG: alpha-glucan family phosphorylase [Dehalococcoidia bacterium]